MCVDYELFSISFIYRNSIFCRYSDTAMKTIGAVCFLCFLAVINSRPVQKRKVLDSLKSTNTQSLFAINSSLLKRGWCKTRSVEQTVKMPGCLPVKIVNNYCFGQCSSIYIPHYNSPIPAFESCTACTPVKMNWRSVTLRCPGAKVKVRKHRYRHVKRCRCKGIRLRSAGIP